MPLQCIWKWDTSTGQTTNGMCLQQHLAAPHWSGAWGTVVMHLSLHTYVGYCGALWRCLLWFLAIGHWVQCLPVILRDGTSLSSATHGILLRDTMKHCLPMCTVMGHMGHLCPGQTWVWNTRQQCQCMVHDFSSP